LSLDSVLVDSDSAVVPTAELLSLRKFTLTSSHIGSTAFLVDVDHVYAPNLESLDIDVGSDKTGLEFERLLKPLSSWKVVERVQVLRIDSDPVTGALMLSGRNKGPRPSIISITIHGCTWSKQRSLINYFPNAFKVELLANCPLGHLLHAASLDNLSHLRIHENINFQLLNHLRPDGRYREIHTVELNCLAFLDRPFSRGNAERVGVTECINSLERSNSLKLLRLYGYGEGLTTEDARAFDNYGFRHGVTVELVGPRFPFHRITPEPTPPSATLAHASASMTRESLKRKEGDNAEYSFANTIVSFDALAFQNIVADLVVGQASKVFKRSEEFDTSSICR
jgi:hypothetical protein